VSYILGKTPQASSYVKTDDRAAGVWLIRNGQMRFALPITTGIRPGISDYLPAPHGLPGFAAPVEQLKDDQHGDGAEGE